MTVGLANFLFENGVDFLWIVQITVLVGFLVLDYVRRDHPIKFVVSYGKTDELFHGLTFLVVPKRYFVHFYIVSVLWSFLLFCDVVNVFYWNSDDSSWIVQYFCSTKTSYKSNQVTVLLCLTMIFIQGCRRLYECIFVSVFSANSSMNLIHYGVGLCFYAFEPITIFHKIGPLTNLEVGNLTIVHGFGIFLFLVASYYQHQAFFILASLRRSDKDSAYKIPRGQLFEFISCPHYFMEIVIYLSLTIVMSFSHFSWVYVLLFVIAIHMQMAKMSQDWYKLKFKNFPKNRKSLIPFLF